MELRRSAITPAALKKHEPFMSLAVHFQLFGASAHLGAQALNAGVQAPHRAAQVGNHACSLEEVA